MKNVGFARAAEGGRKISFGAFSPGSPSTQFVLLRSQNIQNLEGAGGVKVHKNL